MTEFDPVNNFHLHAGMFNYTAAGTENTSPIVTDIVTLSQGDRGIIEFTPQNKGMMMFHSHVNEFSQLGGKLNSLPFFFGYIVNLSKSPLSGYTVI
jgi:manganese oxidase